MPKGTDTPIQPTLAKAVTLGDTFTVKDLGVPYSTVKVLLDGKYIKEGKIAPKPGRGRNPKTYALTAKGKKAAA